MTKSNVYIVDDDEAVCKSTELLLSSSEKYDVRWFTSGEFFLSVLPKLEPGCVVVDWHLDDIDGLNVVAALVRDDRAFPAILTSGATQSFTLATALRAGAVDFLAKPCPARGLLEAIDRGADRLSGSNTVSRSQLLQLPFKDLDILVELATDHSIESIAAANGLSRSAVTAVQDRLMLHFGVNNRDDLLRAAFAGGIAEIIKRGLDQE